MTGKAKDLTIRTKAKDFVVNTKAMDISKENANELSNIQVD